MTPKHDWTPAALFASGADGGIYTPVEGGLRTQLYRNGVLVDDYVTPMPAEQANGRFFIRAALPIEDVRRVENYLLRRPDIGADGVDDVSHLNAASLLPPVACPLLIEVDGRLRRAERTGIIANKADGMEYRLDDGSLIYGRFPWTYP